MFSKLGLPQFFKSCDPKIIGIIYIVRAEKLQGLALFFFFFSPEKGKQMRAVS